MDQEIPKQTNPKYIWVVLAAVILIAGLIFAFQKFQKEKPAPSAEKKPVGVDKEKVGEIKKFGSVEEFKDYVGKSKGISGFFGGRGAGGPGPLAMESADAEKALPPADLSAPSRVSETNVQVAGIDEPDAVKTDGKEIYFSVPRPEIMPMDDTVGRPDESRELFPLQQTGGTKSIKAFPPDDMKVDSKLSQSGDLLLAGNTLIVIPTQRYYWAQNANKIYGFDVTDPKNPKELWNIEMKEAVSVVGARLAKGKLYLATKTDIIDENRFCT